MPSTPAEYDFTQARPRSLSTADITARNPPSIPTRYRGTFTIVPAWSRRNESSTAAIESAGPRRRVTSASVSDRVRLARLSTPLPRDHADLAVCLEHRPGDFVHRRDLLKARLDHDLLDGDP